MKDLDAATCQKLDPGLSQFLHAFASPGQWTDIDFFLFHQQFVSAPLWRMPTACHQSQHGSS